MSTTRRCKAHRGCLRRVRFEHLEERRLLAVGSMADEPLATPQEMAHYRRLDVNDDGLITARDVLQVINELRRAHENPANANLRCDVNGDLRVSALDALWLINDVGRHEGPYRLPRYVATPELQPGGHLMIYGTMDRDLVSVSKAEGELVVDLQTADIQRTHRYGWQSVVDIVFAGYGGEDQFCNKTSVPSSALMEMNADPVELLDEIAVEKDEQIG